MIPIKIDGKDGSWSIIDTKTLALPLGCSYFKIEFNEISIGFEFRSNETNHQSVEVMSNTPNSPVIALFNFNNALGTAIQAPAGHYRGKEIMLSLNVHAMSDGKSSQPARNVSYSLIQRIA